VTDAATPFRCEPKHIDDSVWFAVSGELDAHTAPLLVAHVRQAMGNACASVHLDLAGVGFMDSAGVQALERCRREAEARAARLVLHRPAVPVSQVLDLTGFARIIEIADTGLGDPDG
jgi:anti-anti-sigma factor